MRRHNYGPKGKKLSISITPRQLEGLIRLSEAAARVRLSNVVTADDARLAISLVQNSLMNVGIDTETGNIDIDKVLIGETHSQREKVKRIKNTMKKYQETHNTQRVPIVHIIKDLVENGESDVVASEYIKRLLKRGDLMRIEEDVIAK